MRLYLILYFILEWNYNLTMLDFVALLSHPLAKRKEVTDTVVQFDSPNNYGA